MKKSTTVKTIFGAAIVGGALVAGVALGQYQLVDMIAGNVVTKYQNATCEQLWEARGKPKSAQEQEFVQLLRTNSGMRTEFINRIAAPVANKMFECGMIP